MYFQPATGRFLMNFAMSIKNYFRLELEYYCRRGNVNKIYNLLARGAILRDEAIYYCFLCPNILYNNKLINLLTNCIKNLNFTPRNSNDLSFIHLAAFSGCPDLVRKLLERGADINATYLLQVPETVDRHADALCAAAREGHLEVVKVLCDWASQKQIKLTKKHQALISACRHSHHKVISFLAMEKDININAADQVYCSPLHAARHHLAVTTTLLEHGADANVHNASGSTLLLDAIALALKHECKSRYAMITLLLQFGADVNLADTTTGETPLMKAALARSFELTSVLLEAGADVTQANNADQTVFMLLGDDNRVLMALCTMYLICSDKPRATYKPTLK